MSFRRKITRRQFIKGAAIAGGAMMMPGMRPFVRDAYAFSNSQPLIKFTHGTTPLAMKMREFGVDIPLAFADTAKYTNMNNFTVVAGTYRDQLHPDLPNPTRLYGYGASVSGGQIKQQDAVGGAVAAKHLGHAIVAKKGKPARLQFSNALPATHIIPFDSTITQGLGITPVQDKAAIHLHGGLVPWSSDGGPFHWIAPNGSRGSSVANWLPDNTGAPTADLYYPNNQSARFMWYHDHAIGTTRTSAYAGLASGYVLLDDLDPVLDELMRVYGYSPTELLMVFQDKIFWTGSLGLDPAYGGMVAPGAVAGDLWYPYLYEKARWKVSGPGKNLPIPSVIAEFFGDTMLVNGTVYPYKDVNKGAYWMRTLNACNARFLNLKFVYETGTTGEPAGGYLLPTPAPVNVWMIGTEAGFLPAPVQLLANGLPPAGFVPTPLNPGPWLQGPAERFELIVDFTSCLAGSKVLLYNDAQAPFPVGAPVNDYYPGAPKNPVITTAGFGPNTRTIMRFNVSAATGRPLRLPSFGYAGSAMSLSNPVLPTVADTLNGGLKLAAIPGSSVTHNGVSYTFLSATQELTLNENFDIQGRLQQLVGTTVPLVKGTLGRAYLDAPTEFVQYKTIQIWNIYNLTADTHPMHVHLFNAMILRRRPFSVASFAGIPNWTGPGRGPDPSETGWKETFKMNPGECTTIAILVEDPLPGRTAAVTGTYTGVPFNYTGNLLKSPRLLSAYGLNADEYVWHCHILEHEEHDMMRPLVAT